ncbi:MAG: MotE family protein [Roseovarius sp.]
MKNSKQKPQKRGTRRKLAQRSGLVVIAALLIGSAALRTGENAGQAFALANEADKNASPDVAPKKDVEGYATEDLQAMLEAFRMREVRLKAQEDALRDRMHALKIVDERVAQKLEALAAAEIALRDTIALAETAAEGDLARLTKVYETMKPKQAAALFEEMTPEFAAGFLGRMRPDAAAAILAGLNPEAAHRFSVVLAGRNANVPSE